jgi:hypothetical protein
MLHVHHEQGGVLVLGFEGILDEGAVSAVLSAIALLPLDERVVVDVLRAPTIRDHCLIDLVRAMGTERSVIFRGLRQHHERLLAAFKRKAYTPTRLG